MSDVFPKRASRLPLLVVAGALLVTATLAVGVSYFFTPKYTRAGYQPRQPVAFSHKVHAGQLGLDCLHCHTQAEESWFAGLPTARSCMNCHNQVLREDPRLAPVAASVQTGAPIPWVQIHRLADYTCFHHAAHVTRGVGCADCHGRVDQMTETRQVQPLSMAFCLACHRQPERFLRPPDRVTDMAWSPSSPEQQLRDGAVLAQRWKIQRLENCSACHR